MSARRVVWHRRPLALARDRVQAGGLVIGTDVSTYFDQIDASAS